MLKLKCINYPKNNNWYFDFVDEFSQNSYNGKTFQTLAEAVFFANDTLSYKGKCFDLFSINNHDYFVETR